jgi:hypothetical protein
MKIDCFLSQGCGSEGALKTNIALAIKNEDVEAEVSFRRVADDKALSLGVSGSPSVLINGDELQPLEAKGFS